MDFWKEKIVPSSLLAGTIIGAGIFSLPFVFVKAGIATSFLLLAIFTLAFIVIHLMYADVIKREGDHHRFAGFAKIYFGRLGYWLSILMTIVEMFFVLAIYLILASSFSNLIFPQIPEVQKVLVFWVVGSIIIFSGTKKLAFSEFLATLGIFLSIAVIIYLGTKSFSPKNFSLLSSDWKYWILPFGPLLFALNGRPAIPSVIHYFKRIGKNIVDSKKAVIIGTIVPGIIYTLFVIGILGISPNPSENTISSIINLIPLWAKIIIIGFLGIFSLLSSYFSIGLDLKNSINFDLKYPKMISGILVLFLPLLIYLLNPGGFIYLIEIAGGVFIGLEGIFILLMWKKGSKKEPPVFFKNKSPFIFYPLLAIFIISLVYVVLDSLSLI